MGSISCPETSASNYKLLLHNIPRERRSQVVAMLSSLLLPGLANERLPKLFQRYYVCGPHLIIRRADSHLRITKRGASGNKIVPSCFHLRQEMTESTKTHCLAVNMPQKWKVINHCNYADGCPWNSQLTILLQIEWVLRNPI
jgi:hypothetical protein